jgi:large subunit ribosomal protein L18
MYKVILRNTNLERRKLRVRKDISGTQEKPRLSVFRSNKYIYAQIIDDVAGKTLASVSGVVSSAKSKDNKVKKAFELGKELAEKALANNVSTVVFDRNGYRYHGRVKSLADGAREGGLKL